jgi:hypothetical protein
MGQQKYRIADGVPLTFCLADDPVLAHDVETEAVVFSETPKFEREHRWTGSAWRDTTQLEKDAYDEAIKEMGAAHDAEVKALKAALLVIKTYCNALKAEVRGLVVLLVQKSVITNQEANALTTYDGSGAGDSKTNDDLREDYKQHWKSLP